MPAYRGVGVGCAAGCSLLRGCTPGPALHAALPSASPASPAAALRRWAAPAGHRRHRAAWTALRGTGGRGGALSVGVRSVPASRGASCTLPPLSPASFSCLTALSISAWPVRNTRMSPAAGQEAYPIISASETVQSGNQVLGAAELVLSSWPPRNSDCMVLFLLSGHARQGRRAGLRGIHAGGQSAAQRGAGVAPAAAGTAPSGWLQWMSMAVSTAACRYSPVWSSSEWMTSTGKVRPGTCRGAGWG